MTLQFEWRLVVLRYLSNFSWFVLFAAVYFTAALGQIRFATIERRAEWFIFTPAKTILSYVAPVLTDSDKDVLDNQKAAIDFLLVMIVVLMSLAPAFYLPYQIRKLTEDQPLKIFRRRNEESKNRHMLNRYNSAESITVMAGTFGWLAANADLAARIIKMANENKATFISSRTPNDVSIALKDNPELHNAVMRRLRCRKGQKIVCSLLVFHNTTSFMYLHDDESICELQDIDQGRYLLKSLNVFVEDVSAASEVATAPIVEREKR